MGTNTESTGSIPENTPYGKVMGIVKDRDQLLAVSQALTKLGIDDIKVLDGSAGVYFLDGEQDAVSATFLGDMESEMVKRYVEAVKNGLIAFAAVVEPGKAEQAAKVVKALGATEIVHFGSWVITNY